MNQVFAKSEFAEPFNPQLLFVDINSFQNRILSAMAYAVGIEESTALVVSRDSCGVVGDGQVMVFSRPEAYLEQDGKIGFKRMKISAYLPGTGFKFQKL